MRMRLLWIALISLVWAPAESAAGDGAEHLYQAARKSYYALKADPARRKFRHHWLNVAHRFELVATKFPRSNRAPDALFTSGELLQELSHISTVREDLDESVADYQRLIERYPHHRLADDAALALGKIYLQRLAQPETAGRILSQGIKQNPKGDRVPELKAVLASLAKESTRRTLAPKAPPGSEHPGDSAATARVEKPAPRPEAGDANAKRSQKDAALEHTSSSSKVTLVEQLGLKVRRVVVDPGHGGYDTGAIGPSGTREKDVALSIARRLARALTAAGLEVVLTRNDDVFLPLEDRARLANQAKGDLFISIHCNSATQRKLRGIETYTLNTSSNRYAIRLAARENASSERRISDLQFILADLATKADADESLRLARKVQHGLVSQLRLKHGDVRDLGTKEALFYVLLGAKMPAILVETSFLSNREEEKRLASSRYQEEVAAAIASGVREFLGDRQRVAERD